MAYTNAYMGKAARAIIIEGDSMLVMRRMKYGSEYFTLVGGQSKEGESIEDTLIREVKEETGLDVTRAWHVFTEEHAAPYNHQYIYLCEVAPHDKVEIHELSEEGQMNRLDMNVHELVWANIKAFHTLPFRTPQLQGAIIEALKKGFPNQAKLL